MLRVSCVGICVALLLATSAPVAAQQAGGDLDEPCTAAVGPAGYGQVSRLIPGEASPLARAKVRGVVARPLVWQPGQTLSICFRSGTQKARARVAEFANEWLKYANLKFDFGDPPDPRMCQAGSTDAIKIDFVSTGPKVGYWSALGRLSLQSDHSMNLSFLGQDELPRNKAGQQMPMAEARRIVLHEFGHALGMLHEHQSPAGGCGAEYYEEAVIAYGALRGWPPEKSIHNFKQLADHPELNATEIDRKSIMHYALPPWLFKSGPNSPCAVATPNSDLSERDKEFIARIYPKAAGPVAMSTVRGAKSAMAADTPEKLSEDYRKSLQEAGVGASRVEALVRDFKALLAE